MAEDGNGSEDVEKGSGFDPEAKKKEIVEKVTANVLRQLSSEANR